MEQQVGLCGCVFVSVNGEAINQSVLAQNVQWLQ